MTPGQMVIVRGRGGRCHAFTPARVKEVSKRMVLVQPNQHGHAIWVAVSACKLWKKGNYNRRTA